MDKQWHSLSEKQVSSKSNTNFCYGTFFFYLHCMHFGALSYFSSSGEKNSNSSLQLAIALFCSPQSTWPELDFASVSSSPDRLRVLPLDAAAQSRSYHSYPRSTLFKSHSSLRLSSDSSCLEILTQPSNSIKINWIIHPVEQQYCFYKSHYTKE